MSKLSLSDVYICSLFQLLYPIQPSILLLLGAVVANVEGVTSNAVSNASEKPNDSDANASKKNYSDAKKGKKRHGRGRRRNRRRNRDNGYKGYYGHGSVTTTPTTTTTTYDHCKATFCPDPT